LVLGGQHDVTIVGKHYRQRREDTTAAALKSNLGVNCGPLPGLYKSPENLVMPCRI
jgi:hypothetical protein